MLSCNTCLCQVYTTFVELLILIIHYEYIYREGEIYIKRYIGRDQTTIYLL